MLKEKWLWIITTMSVIGLFNARGCWEEERVALLHIKAHFSDPDSVYLCFKTWEEDKGSDCCDGWNGVSCGNEGRVVSLSLGACFNGQHLNASVFHPFQQLRELYLSDNNIVSWTEDQGSKMKLSLNLGKLEVLDLSFNNFTKSVLPHLSGFQSLKRLWLIGNNLRLVKLNDFGAFKNLKELDLSLNFIESFVSYNEAAAEENTDTGNLSSILKNLEKLDLTRSLPKRSINILLHLNALQSLKYLSLAANDIRGHIQLCGSAKWSSSLTNLKTLNLSGTSLNRSALQHLIGFRSLEHLRLGGNQLGGYNNLYGLCQLKKLQTLDLNSNHYLDEMLPPCLGNLTALRVLDLSRNQLAGRIPLWLSNLSALQQLDLSRNHFTENIALSVLVNLTNLESLELSDNYFHIPSSFKSFSNHTKLKRFIADFNEVILDSDDPLFASGFQLQILSLSNCRLTSYPSFLGHQYNLLVVDLSNNFLQGNFPTWLVANTSSLKGLFLENNSITGSIQLPSSLHHANMVALDISQNQIQGQIPEHMGDIFSQLQLLNMFSNELQGKIPWSFGRMKSLWDLNLSNNSLIGTFPRSLLEGCLSLRSLVVSNNNLDGLIPSFYLQHDLEILSLENNLLKGSIPRGICSLHRLQYLDLSHNNLDGPIPSCFSKLTSLESIHLRNNKLRGQIILPYYCSLITLDLNNNKFNGGIPSQIGNCTFLEALLLQGNMLDGEIPIQLCHLGYLYILDLSHNNLSGSIPSCLGSVAFLHIFFVFYDTNKLPADSVAGAYVNTNVNHFNIIREWVDFTTKSVKYSYEEEEEGILSGIDLSCNMLMGKIPHELGNLTNIHSLNISHNHLWGDIPKSFSNLTQIESLDLSYNSLSGSIPTELIALHFLAVFKVMHNNLSGKIPFAIQFSTFNESNYEANPFLCGPPLSKKCALSPANANGFQDHVIEGDSGWIDMENFYVSFVVTGIIMFLVVLLIIWINPNWRRAWFYLATNCATSSYYFVGDIIKKIKRVRNV